MKTWIVLLAAVQVVFAASIGEPMQIDAELSTFLREVNDRLSVLYNREVLAGWLNEINGPNDLIALLQSNIATEDIMNFLKKISPTVMKFKKLYTKNDSLKRQLNEIPEEGYEALGVDDLALIIRVTSQLGEIYSETKICNYYDRSQCDLSLVPDVQNILSNLSSTTDEIEYYWVEWRRSTGDVTRQNFKTFIELYRKTANLNGYPKASDFWFKDLEEDAVEALKLLEGFMTQIRPLYEQFHAHIRGAMRQLYGEKLIPRAQPYPQSLADNFMGNAYKKSPTHIEFPYPEIGVPNITAGLLNNGFTDARKVFDHVEGFFKSIGMPELGDNFWQNYAHVKAISKSDNNEIKCWHKAWKCYGVNEVNFTYCPIVNGEKFQNMFEAISDLYYYAAFEKQPLLFQEEPFPNFSDALGKVFSLAASSPKYLEKKNIIPTGYTTKEARLNRLYLQGIRLIFLLPILYVLDRYRVDVIDGKFDMADNCAYWDLTEQYNGAAPPVERTKDDYDVPAKLLIEVEEQYTSQIMGVILQFQLYKHFCELTGQYKHGDPDYPLDLCDLSDQPQLGPIVLNAMSLGTSLLYKDILKLLTNETVLSPDGFIEYFEPLKEWLVQDNQLANNEIGWGKSEKCKT